MSEPTPFRDNGPYRTADQARAQVAAVTHGIPEHQQVPGSAGELVLTEALMLAGVQVGEWEDVARQDIARTLPPEVVQVIAGWVLRARHPDLTTML